MAKDKGVEGKLDARLDAEIKEIGDLSGRNDFNQFSKNCLNNELSCDKIPTAPPSSPEAAFAMRRLAFSEQGLDKEIRAWWQNYWLSCCLSSKCDYIFAILAKYDVDREEDILSLLGKKFLLTSYIPDKGQEYYYNRCISFLLRRYSLRRAWRLWHIHKSPQGLISLFLPRMFGTTILGVLSIASATETSTLPMRIWQSHPYWWYGLLVACVLCPFLVLCYETRKVTESGSEQTGCVASLKYFMQSTARRASLIYFIGLAMSFAISAIPVWIIPPPLGSTPITPLWENWAINWVFFAVWALFIGIFLQSFWEEKTIAEPL